jgi:hypothetical protein
MTTINQTQKKENEDNLYRCTVSLSFEFDMNGKSEDAVRKELETHYSADDLWEKSSELGSVDIKIEEIDELN